MAVRIKKLNKTKIAVKASTPSAMRTVLRRLGVDPELAKGDQKKIDPAHLQPPGAGRKTTAKKPAAKKATAKKAAAKGATAKKSTATRATAKRVRKGGRARRPGPSA